MNGRVTVIGTFYKRFDNTAPIVRRLFVESTRKPDETFLMCEEIEDFDVAFEAAREHASDGTHWEAAMLPTPRHGNKYEVIPYSYKINQALDWATGDYILYVDNGSMPHPRKIELMAQALDDNPDWNAVYCPQDRGEGGMWKADKPTHGYNALNYTQVMHRRTPERWVLDPKYGNPDFADALFWRAIGDSKDLLFYPVDTDLVLDVHHITNHAVEGL